MDSKIETVRGILRRHRNRTLIPIVVILSIIAALSYAVNYPTGQTIGQNETVNQTKILDQAKEEKIDYLIPGVLAIIALIISFTFFYSGKMNDYKKDYIQRVAELEEFVAKTKRWLNTIENPDAHVDNCKHLVDQGYQYLQNPNNRISFTSTHVGILSIVVLGLIFASFGMINSPYLDLIDALYAIAVFVLGIFYLYRLWLMYEQIINLYNDDLTTLNQFIGTLKSMHD